MAILATVSIFPATVAGGAVGDGALGPWCDGDDYVQLTLREPTEDTWHD